MTEALSLVEFASIATGTRAVDALVKKAPITLLRVGTLQPGKLAVLFGGDVASVEASHAEALAVGGTCVDDHVMLAHVDRTVYDAVVGKVGDWRGDTIGVVETNSMAATIQAADAAVKGAAVRVVSIRLGDELGGKGLAHFCGELHDIEAAIDIATDHGGRGDRVVHTSITARVDDEVRQRLSQSTRFWGDG